MRGKGQKSEHGLTWTLGSYYFHRFPEIHCCCGAPWFDLLTPEQSGRQEECTDCVCSPLIDKEGLYQDESLS